MNRSKPKIGIAFGGGGTRAGAHVGVLEVLEANGISADIVSGTSAGSAIAALYAWGYNSAYLKQLFFSAELRSLVDARPSLTGLLVPQGYLDIIRQQTGDGNIEDSAKPLYIMAADLVSRSKIIFDKGSIVTAVHASSAMPGIMKPVKSGSMMLADGGILNNCPTQVLREHGADIVLGINCSCMAEFRPKNHIDILFRAIDMMGDGNPDNIEADWLISPIDEPLGVLDKKAIEKSYELGKHCALQHIEELKELLRNYGNQG